MRGQVDQPLLREVAGLVDHPRVEALDLRAQADRADPLRDVAHQRARVPEHVLAEVHRAGGERRHVRPIGAGERERPAALVARSSPPRRRSRSGRGCRTACGSRGSPRGTARRPARGVPSGLRTWMCTIAAPASRHFAASSAISSAEIGRYGVCSRVISAPDHRRGEHHRRKCAHRFTRCLSFGVTQVPDGAADHDRRPRAPPPPKRRARGAGGSPSAPRSASSGSCCPIETQLGLGLDVVAREHRREELDLLVGAEQALVAVEADAAARSRRRRRARASARRRRGCRRSARRARSSAAAPSPSSPRSRRLSFVVGALRLLAHALQQRVDDEVRDVGRLGARPEARRRSRARARACDRRAARRAAASSSRAAPFAFASSMNWRALSLCTSRWVTTWLTRIASAFFSIARRSSSSFGTWLPRL